MIKVLALLCLISSGCSPVFRTKLDNFCEMGCQRTFTEYFYKADFVEKRGEDLVCACYYSLSTLQIQRKLLVMEQDEWPKEEWPEP